MACSTFRIGQADDENQLCRIPVPAEVIHQAIWLYLQFTLSLRDVEDLLAERGVAVSYETVRRWVNHFGPMIAANLRKRRLKPHATWHLDEVYLKIDGRLVYLWRAVDAEGEVLDVLVQSKRNKRAALKLMRKLLKKCAFVPERLVTDDLRGIGLIRAESGDAVIVDFVKLRARAERRKLPMPRGGGSRLRLGQNLRHCGANHNRAIGMRKRPPIAANLFLARKRVPFRKLRLGRRKR